MLNHDVQSWKLLMTVVKFLSVSILLSDHNCVVLRVNVRSLSPLGSFEGTLHLTILPVMTFKLSKLKVLVRSHTYPSCIDILATPLMSG